jgi:DNA polymerase-3 subunit beta
MKIEILQENLIKGLTTVSRIIAGKIQLPILGNVLLETIDGQLKLTGTNLEISLETMIGAKILVDGSFTVPARTLTEIVGSLPAGKVVLERKEGQLVVTSGNFTAKINGIPASDWPTLELKDNDKEIKFALDFLKFKEIVGKIIIAVGIDESRPALTGVLVKGGNNLTLVTTDGFRLSQIITGIKTDEFAAVIPAKAIAEIARMEGKNLKISVSPNSVTFYLEETILVARLIAGNFPPYEKIIPRSLDNSITIDAPELLKAVKLAGIFARDSANIVKFVVHGSSLIVKSQAQQTGENENEIEIKNEKPQDEEFVIAFNFHYLMDLLNAVGDSELKFAYSTPLAAGLFEVVGNKDFLHLIMPVRVQN